MAREGRKDKTFFIMKCRGELSACDALHFIIGIFGGVIWIVIPELVNALAIIVQGATGLINKLNAMSEAELEAFPLANLILSIDWDGVLASIQTWLKNEGGTIVNSAFSTITSLVGGVFNFFISFIFAVYILLGKDKLKRQACHIVNVWLPKGLSGWLIHAASVANVTFRNFISGQSLEAVTAYILFKEETDKREKRLRAKYNCPIRKGEEA